MVMHLTYINKLIYIYAAIEVNSYLDTGALILIHFHCVNLLESHMHVRLNIHEVTLTRYKTKRRCQDQVKDASYSTYCNSL